MMALPSPSSGTRRFDPRSCSLSAARWAAAHQWCVRTGRCHQLSRQDPDLLRSGFVCPRLACRVDPGVVGRVAAGSPGHRVKIGVRLAPGFKKLCDSSTARICARFGAVGTAPHPTPAPCPRGSRRSRPGRRSEPLPLCGRSGLELVGHAGVGEVARADGGRSVADVELCVEGRGPVDEAAVKPPPFERVDDLEQLGRQPQGDALVLPVVAHLVGVGRRR